MTYSLDMIKHNTNVKTPEMHTSLACVFMPLCQKDGYDHDTPVCICFTVQYHVMFTCLCTCIHALSINQHRWKVGYTGFFCRSQTNIQGRGLACWLGTPHLVVDCPAACNVHSGARPSCSLQAENQRVDWKETLNHFSLAQKKWTPVIMAFWAGCTGSCRHS